MADDLHSPTALGASGLKVSKLWLGAMMFGDQTDEAEAARIVAATRDAGLNAIDTADAYAKGDSERIVGRLIANDRERWVVATKLFNPTSKDANDRGLSRRHMLRAVDASLARLGTDRVEILYLHHEDETTPLEETVAAMAHLLASGKVLYFGVSNFRAWRVARLVEMCRAAGIPPPIVSQPPYNAMTRAIETELLPCCAHYGVGVVAYSPMQAGLLTGTFTRERAAALGPDDWRSRHPFFQEPQLSKNLRLVDGLRPIAARLGISVAQLVLAWTLRDQAVSSASAGARSPKQIQETVAAGNVDLPADAIAEIEQLLQA